MTEQKPTDSKNGQNGSGNGAAARPSGQMKTESSVEKSLEDFIARANSSFVDATKWEKPPALATGSIKRRTPRGTMPPQKAPEIELESSEIQKVEPVEIEAKTALPDDTAPNPKVSVDDPEKTEAVHRVEAVEVTVPRPKAAVAQAAHKTSKNVYFAGAFIAGAGLVFLATRLIGGGDKQPEKIAPAPTMVVVTTAPPPAPAPAPVAAPAPAAAPAAAAPAPVVQPLADGSRPTVEPLPAANPTPAPANAAPAPKVEPLPQAAPTAAAPPAAEPAAAAPAVAKKVSRPKAAPAKAAAEPKAAKPAKAEKKAEDKKPAGLVDPFAQ